MRVGKFLMQSLILTIVGCAGQKEMVQLPGRQNDGRILLPNGWSLEPAGTHLDLGDLPLALDITPDEKYAAVANSGFVQDLYIVDLQKRTVTDKLALDFVWLGVRFFENGKRLAVSGGNSDQIILCTFDTGKVTPTDTMRLKAPSSKKLFALGGIEISRDNTTLYATTKDDSSLFIFDIPAKQLRKQIKMPAELYTCKLHPAKPELYVSIWGGKQAAILDCESEEISAFIPVGDHPNDMAILPGAGKTGDRLFVANANLNSVSMIDLAQRRVIETIITSLVADAPPGSTPNGLALSPDGEKLFVANADNNYVAVFKVEEPGRSVSLGFIPVGWYPTAAYALKSSSTLLVINGKGHGGSRANPRGPNPYVKNTDDISEYIGRMFRGSLSFLAMPDDAQLRDWSRKVFRNSPYYQRRQHEPEVNEKNPLIARPSPIKYVFYIVKENRTYDQVLGDMKEGNGDSSICLFPEFVTPNHHALAREFILLDNLYAAAEVSADGHEWSMGAYATDYVEKNWPGMYGDKGGKYPAEGVVAMAAPSSGYIWDLCKRADISFRSYGEFVDYAPGRKDSVFTTIETLQGNYAPNFPPYDLSVSDTRRFRLWRSEFDHFVQNGSVPRFQIIRLPNDHTSGTRKNSPTPRAMVAENDLALGMMVEHISKSPVWKECAIFVVEDDAQNGPDHVDAHRMIGFVISPYTKRHFVDSHMYSTTSVLRSMELILGLPPMTQFDAAALPMFASFTDQPDFQPYVCKSANIDLKEMNKDMAYGQQRSGEMNLAKEDAIPDVEFNEIIWKSIRGADSEMPAPVRSAFVRVAEEEDD